MTAIAQGNYQPLADGSMSYLVAVIELRDRHRRAVETFLPALVHARNARSLSRRLLAIALGVSESAIQTWENRQHIPPADIFSRWRAVLDC